MFEEFITKLNHVYATQIQPGDIIKRTTHPGDQEGPMYFFLKNFMPDRRDVWLPDIVHTGPGITKLTHKAGFSGLIVVLDDSSDQVVTCTLYTLEYFAELYEPNTKDNWQFDNFGMENDSGFEWALVHLKDGRDLKREAWGDQVSVTVKKDANGSNIEPIEFVMESDGFESTWVPSIEDIGACDWQVIFHTLEEPTNDSSTRLLRQ